MFVAVKVLHDICAVNQHWKADLLIVLGGGCGQNLIRASRGKLYTLLHRTYLLNTEFSHEGRELSDKVFKHFQIESSIDFTSVVQSLF